MESQESFFRSATATIIILIIIIIIVIIITIITILIIIIMIMIMIMIMISSHLKTLHPTRLAVRGTIHKICATEPMPSAPSNP